MYKVEFSHSAKKDLEKVNIIYLVSVASHIKKLSENPRPFGHDAGTLHLSFFTRLVLSGINPFDRYIIVEKFTVLHTWRRCQATLIKPFG